MKSRCSIEIRFPDKDAAGAAMKAISHEGSVGNRSDAKVSVKGDLLTVDISAEDVVAMRASSNAFLRALQAFESIEKEVRK